MTKVHFRSLSIIPQKNYCIRVDFFRRMWYDDVNGGGVMLRIAIVDDEAEQIEIVQKIVYNYFESSEMKICISTFLNGEDLLSDPGSYDLIFLDIQMGGMDGIETAQKIRSRDKKVSLIYISNFIENMASSFAVHPFAFLSKPVRSCEVQKHLNDYVSYISSLYQKQMVSFQGQHGEIVVNMRDIIYFEYESNRKICLVTTDARYYIMGSIKALIKRLEKNDFLSPHKSFLVNEYHIKSFYSSLIMNNGDEIPIAKNRMKYVTENISIYLHHHLMD